MIKYRPHRSTLDESIKLCKKFNTLNEMIKYVENEWIDCKISIDEKEYKDDRIHWDHWHYVLANGCAIGMCDLGEDK